MLKYSLRITWLEQTQKYIAESPEFPVLQGEGGSWATAAADANLKLADIIDQAKIEGSRLPMAMCWY